MLRFNEEEKKRRGTRLALPSHWLNSNVGEKVPESPSTTNPLTNTSNGASSFPSTSSSPVTSPRGDLPKNSDLISLILKSDFSALEALASLSPVIPIDKLNNEVLQSSSSVEKSADLLLMTQTPEKTSKSLPSTPLFSSTVSMRLTSYSNMVLIPTSAAL